MVVEYALPILAKYKVYFLPLLCHVWLWRISLLALGCTDFKKKKMELHWHSSMNSLCQFKGNQLKGNTSNILPQGKRLVTHMLKVKTETAVSMDETKLRSLKVDVYKPHFYSLQDVTPPSKYYRINMAKKLYGY